MMAAILTYLVSCLTWLVFFIGLHIGPGTVMKWYYYRQRKSSYFYKFVKIIVTLFCV